MNTDGDRDDSISGSMGEEDCDEFFVARSNISVDSKMEAEQKMEKISIAENESKAIKKLKKFVIAFLVLAAAGVATAVFSYAKAADDFAIEEDYEEYADLVFKSLGDSMIQALYGADSFVVNIVSQVEGESNVSRPWPFVNIPNFASRASKLKSQTKVKYTSLAFFVSKAQREDWESYTMWNNKWV